MVKFHPIQPPTTGIVFQSDNVRLKIADRIIDNGSLYITLKSLSWQPLSMDEGIEISWDEIAVHGVQREPEKCVYFMVDQKFACWQCEESHANGANGHNNGANGHNNGANGHNNGTNGHNNGANEAENSDSEYEGNALDEQFEDTSPKMTMTECWLLPVDWGAVNLIYQCMRDCQSLYPVSTDDETEEEEFDDDEFDPYGPMRNLNIN